MFLLPISNSQIIIFEGREKFIKKKKIGKKQRKKGGKKVEDKGMARKKKPKKKKKRKKKEKERKPEAMEPSREPARKDLLKDTLALHTVSQEQGKQSDKNIPTHWNPMNTAPFQSREK